MREKINKFGFVLLKPFIVLFLLGTTRARALIICDDEILLVRDWLGSQRWNLPGGGVRKDEKPMAGLVRELEEELNLGVQPKQLKQIMKTEQNELRVKFLAIIFQIKLKKKPKLTIKKNELIEASWHSVAKLPENIQPLVLEALKARQK